ncbi:hypothetical protein J6590_088170, partial [Homalodisca vitripennis]
LFCPPSWATGLCDYLIKQNKGRVDTVRGGTPLTPNLQPPTRVARIAGHQSLLVWDMTDIVAEDVRVDILGTGFLDHFAQFVSISMYLLKEPYRFRMSGAV